MRSELDQCQPVARRSNAPRIKVQREEGDRRTEALPHFKGPGPTTRLLQEVLAHAGTLRGTLLDIGSGIGSLTFGLLERGITRAVAVDASSAYNVVARQEAERLGRQTWCGLFMPTLYLLRRNCLLPHS